MEIQDIPRADLLDILFDGRNKGYGAYDLRKTYNRRLTKALTVTASTCLLLIGGYTLAGRTQPSNARMQVIDDSVRLIDLPVHETPPLPPPPIPRPQLQVATIKNVVPRIVPDQQVKPEEAPPPNDDLDKAKIGTETRAGALSEDIVETPAGNGVTQGVIELPKKPEEDNTIHEFVEIESSYPGGLGSWQRFLTKNFRPPDEVSGTVIVQFVVDKEGNVSDVKAISGPAELQTEAVRVIKRSGKWIPAIQNGRRVNSYKKQPIIVQIQNE